MKYGSICSGIEAATVAFEPLGWEAQWFSEIEPFPCAVLNHHYPNIPNLGDVLNIEKKDEYNERTINLLIGGTPCQSFSIAGLRKGLSDARGNIALKFCEILRDKQPKWFIWENVPGVLSSNGGKDLAAIMAGFRECGYQFAYRIIDAQYHGVAQQRRRLFIVGHLGDWRPAAAVLFERESLFRNYEAGKESREESAPKSVGCPKSDSKKLAFKMQSFSEYSQSEKASTVKARDHKSFTDLIVAQDFMVINGNVVGRTEKSGANGIGITHNICPTLRTSDRHVLAHCFKVRGGSEGGGKGYLGKDKKVFTISTQQDQSIYHKNSIRRLTEIECERLQGFPDNWTKIPYRNKPADNCPSSPRYKAAGNSMAVPVIRWLGERIEEVEQML